MNTSTTPTLPPDLESQNAVLKMRVQAAEAALYQFEQSLSNMLTTFVQPIVKQMHALNQQFPLGDDTHDGAQAIALNAIRAAMPEHKDKTDEELKQLYFRAKS